MPFNIHFFIILVNVAMLKTIDQNSIGLHPAALTPIGREQWNISLACSLAWEKIKASNPKINRFWDNVKILHPKLIDTKQYHFIGVINDSSIIRRHTIVILQPVGFELGPTLGQTCIISDDSIATVLSSKWENEFNNVILKENIKVDRYDIAERIARLFIRIMMPLISKAPLFFADELTYSNYWDYLKEAGRSEMQMFKDENEMLYLYSEYQKKFNKELRKKKWFTQISKKDNSYNVNILTVGRIIAGFNDFASPIYDRIIQWEIVVYKNGSINTKLPKGIRIYTVNDL